MIHSLQASSIPPHLKNYGLQYSPAVCYIASSLQRVHQIWQSYIRGQNYRDPNKWLGLALGQLTKFHFGTNLLVQLTAAPFFVTARILDLFEQEDRVIDAFKTWKGAVKGRHLFKHELSLTAPSKVNRLVSRYRITKWKQCGSTLIQRIRMIFHSSIALISEIFALIMRFMDLLELFTMDTKKMKKQLDRAVLEGGITIPRVLNTLCNNREIFLLRLEKIEQTFIQVVQRDSERVNQSNQLISYSRTFFKQMELGLDVYRTTSEVTGEAAVTLFKEIVFFLTPRHFEKFMRENFYDPSLPNWLRPEESFPPICPVENELFTLKCEIENKELAVAPRPHFVQLSSPLPLTMNADTVQSEVECKKESPDPLPLIQLTTTATATKELSSK